MLNKVAIKTGALIIGTQDVCREFIRNNNQHYVYVLRRPNGRPFYVGKGVGNRVFEHENEARHPNDWRSNAHKLNVIRSILRSGETLLYEIDFTSTDAAAAYAREAELIGAMKRLHEGGSLTNLAPGGGSTAGPAPASKARHSATLGGAPDDNPERAVLNKFVLAIAQMGSVVIKPLAQFTPRPTQRYPTKSIGQSLRQAVALAASASAHGITIDGECLIPRRVTVEGVLGLVENGVACDVLTSGLGAVVPSDDAADEQFHLSKEQARKVAVLIGLRKCADLGIVADDTMLPV